MNPRVAATAIGLLTGAVVGVFGLLIGWVLYVRLFGDSIPALAAFLVVFGATGAYSGWLIGLVLFSALNRPGESGNGT
ncbi:MAG: hypothetical protein M3024_01860 [Candidatus Dormibacteraeota bacterium]|nr:hypothetical protein [Candidatus Dormibacteraeota bacterium]